MAAVVATVLGVCGRVDAFEINTGIEDVVSHWDDTLRYTLAKRHEGKNQISRIAVLAFVSKKGGNKKMDYMPHSFIRNIVTPMLVAAFSLSVIGCEARLDLEGVNKELAKPVRRTDNFQALTNNGTVITAVGNSGLILTSPKENNPEDARRWTRSIIEGRPNFVDITTCPDNSMIALSMERQVWASVNNGQKWTKSDLPTKETVIALTCAPNGDYWVVGAATSILHSTDKGGSWSNTALNQDALINFIQFFDAKNGLVLGEFGLMAKTVDGGQSWQNAQNIPDNFYPMGVYFTDSEHGWVAGLGGAILYTADGGKSWKRQETPNSVPLYGIHAKGNRVFALGDGNTVLELDGQRWVAHDTPPQSTYLRDAEVINNDMLLVAGGNGTLTTVKIKQKQELVGGLSNGK